MTKILCIRTVFFLIPVQYHADYIHATRPDLNEKLESEFELYCYTVDVSPIPTPIHTPGFGFGTYVTASIISL